MCAVCDSMEKLRNIAHRDKRPLSRRAQGHDANLQSAQDEKEELEIRMKSFGPFGNSELGDVSYTRYDT